MVLHWLVATLKKLTALQKQLQDKEAALQELLQSLQGQQSQLSATQAQQASLLAYNQQQQADYNSQLTANNAKIADLRHQQYLANLALSSGGRVVAGDPGHGGYPNYLNNASQDSLIDPWGMYNRECVSYTAWKVQQAFGYMPNWGGVGNANQWPGDARSAGIPTGRTPKVHSVAIWNVGYYGHAMWVEAVNGDGSIWVSQYNYDFTGHYSEMMVSASMASSLTYIYFH
jgi:surface antigen